jgi:PKD repeat protein
MLFVIVILMAGSASQAAPVTIPVPKPTFVLPNCSDINPHNETLVLGLTASPTIVNPNVPSTLTIKLRTSSGVYTSGSVTFTGDGAAYLDPSTVTLDASGVGNTVFRSPVSKDSYTITATASKYCFGSATKTITITVTNLPPTALFTIVTTDPGPAPSEVAFDASASSDEGGSIASYRWDFGDGTTETTSDSHINHTYETRGTYTVGLQVTDNQGLTGAATPQIVTIEAAPTATTTAPPATTTAPPATTTAPPTTTATVPTTTVLAPLMVTFDPVQDMLEEGERVSIVVHVSGPGGVPVAGATVKLSSSEVALVQPEGTTDSTGTYRGAKFIAPGEGEYAINATVLRDGYEAGVSSLPITVGAAAGGGFLGGGLMGLLPFILIAVIIVILVIFLFTRNRL